MDGFSDDVRVVVVVVWVALRLAAVPNRTIRIATNFMRIRPHFGRK
jgi:hypothetical protein